MGVMQHVIQAVFRGAAGVGFAAAPPSFAARALRYVVRELELMKPAMFDGVKTEFDAAEYIARSIRFDESQMGGSCVFAFVSDDRKNVSASKRTVQADRLKRGGKAYSESELNAMFIESRFADGELNETALRGVLTPVFHRLYATPASDAKRAMAKRFDKFVRLAAMRAKKESAQIMEFLQDGEWNVYMYIEEDGAGAYKLVEERPMPVIGEGEMLCIHYVHSTIAALSADERRAAVFMIRCKDTDTFLPLVANTSRIISDNIKSVNEAPAIWLDLSGTMKAASADAAEAAGEEGKGDDAGADKYQTKPFVDTTSVYFAFLRNAKKKTAGTAPWNRFSFPLFTMGIVGVLGGSEKVEKIEGTTPATLFEYAQKEQKVSVALTGRVVEVEPANGAVAVTYTVPVSRRVAQIRRVAVDEPALVELAIRMCAFKHGRNEGAAIDEMLAEPNKPLEERLKEALDVLILWAEAKNSEHQKSVEKADAEAKAAGTKPKYPKFFKKPVPGATLDEVRGRVRRAVWQLTGEFVNGGVDRGLPPCGEVDASTGLSKWGRNADGTYRNDIVPFSSTMNLYN